MNSRGNIRSFPTLHEEMKNTYRIRNISQQKCVLSSVTKRNQLESKASIERTTQQQQTTHASQVNIGYIPEHTTD